jgi:hypothetical protein
MRRSLALGESCNPFEKGLSIKTSCDGDTIRRAHSCIIQLGLHIAT